MNQIRFYKMQGAGNDFVVVFCKTESSESVFRDSPERTDQIVRLCDRKRGIGADGLLFLTPLSDSKFKMDFYNCDGSRASMCGNGLRCAALFASRHGNGGMKPVFATDSGDLDTEIISAANPGIARITINVNQEFHDRGDIGGYRVYSGTAGVPHAVVPVCNIDKIDVNAVGKMLRYHDAFAPSGTNVDFIELAENEDGLHRIRTYERGVEGETLACGTGIASSGIVLHQFAGAGKKVRFLSRSGDVLDVDILPESSILKRVYLTGPAEESFEGTVQVRV